MIKRFELRGHYNYGAIPNGRGELTGEIEMANNGYFEGCINNNGSKVPEQFLRGQMIHGDGLDNLLFLKFPKNERFSSWSYALRKTTDGSISGQYTGVWGALPYQVELDKTSGLFCASIDMSVCSFGDSAEINLNQV